MRFTNDKYDIEAWIQYSEGDRARLPEHRVEQKPEDHRRNGFQYTKGYLEMQEDRIFRIMVKVHKPAVRPHDMDIQLFIDGRDFIGRTYLSTANGGPDVYQRTSMAFMENGQQMVGFLKFSALSKTSEAEAATIFGGAVDNLCSIVLRIREGESRTQPMGRHPRKADTPLNVGTVHEKQMKMGSTVSAGLARVANSMDRLRFFTNLPHDPEVCSFVWKYYTRDMLVIKGIFEDSVPIPSPIRGASSQPRLAFPKVKRPDVDSVADTPSGSGVGSSSTMAKRKHNASSASMPGLVSPSLADWADDEGSGSEYSSDGDSGAVHRHKRVKVVKMLDITAADNDEDAGGGDA